MKKFSIVICLCLFLGMALPAFAQPKIAYQKIENVDTRPGVKVPVLIMKPETKPVGTMIMFPGQGVDEFSSLWGKISLGDNFVVRTAPDYIEQGFAVAIMDKPSDGEVIHLATYPFLSIKFRLSAEHVQDARIVMDYLEKMHNLSNFYILGTSRGQLSVLNMAYSLHDKRVKGYVTTSGLDIKNPLVTSKENRPLDLNRITDPLLIVHHFNDRCFVTLYKSSLELKSKITNSSKLDFIEVHGESPIQNDNKMFQCGPKANHGFYGHDKKVVKAIGDWCLGKEVPKVLK